MGENNRVLENRNYTTHNVSNSSSRQRCYVLKKFRIVQEMATIDWHTFRITCSFEKLIVWMQFNPIKNWKIFEAKLYFSHNSLHWEECIKFSSVLIIINCLPSALNFIYVWHSPFVSIMTSIRCLYLCI